MLTDSLTSSLNYFLIILNPKFLIAILILPKTIKFQAKHSYLLEMVALTSLIDLTIVSNEEII